jgi:uroporphyrinogen III methyltransferase/synthase
LKTGRVYITGAGPGDPGLITIKASEKLKTADVIVFDRLINDELLNYCKPDAEKIYVGKTPGEKCISQDKINKILIEKAKTGAEVVRLKGGNPFIFARGSEEAAALKKENIEFEIIPGITSGFAAPAYSGIPITERGIVTQCVLVTAHESPDKNDSQVEWEKLAGLKNTSFLIYMGASRIEKIINVMIESGLDENIPVAVIENATLPVQRTLTSSAKNVAGEFKKQNFKPPCIIMISPSVERIKELSWWENRQE